MSTQRYISTSFWDDEWIQTLDPSEKLLYLYFMTNPLTNIAGVYKVTERRVSFDTGFNISTIQHIMSKPKFQTFIWQDNRITLKRCAKKNKVIEVSKPPLHRLDKQRAGVEWMKLRLLTDAFHHPRAIL